MWCSGPSGPAVCCGLSTLADAGAHAGHGELADGGPAPSPCCLSLAISVYLSVDLLRSFLPQERSLVPSSLLPSSLSSCLLPTLSLPVTSTPPRPSPGPAPRRRPQAGATNEPGRACQGGSPGRCSQCHTTLYISLVVLHTNYTWRRQNDFNVNAYQGGPGRRLAPTG